MEPAAVTSCHTGCEGVWPLVSFCGGVKKPRPACSQYFVKDQSCLIPLKLIVTL